MKRRLIFLLCLLSITAGLTFSVSGQSSSPPQGWHMLDPEQDHVQGISANRVYAELLKTRPPTPIIVAIIDSGIDINHEDLKSIIWTNPREIEGNGLDDDGNGYIDDVHGWNFLGGANGEVDGDTYELTREYVRLDKTFGKLQENKIPGKLKKEYEEYTRVKDKFLRLRDENRDEYEYYVKLNRGLKMSMDTLKVLLKTDTLTAAAIDSIHSSNPTISFAKGFIKLLLRNAAAGEDLQKIQKDLQEAVDEYHIIVEYGYNPDFDSRKIVGDDPTNPREHHYGNNNVIGPDPMHGTHVAGIIGADRQNQIGINGIAGNVRIMVLRAVPNGDEHDKDIANAIRYAAANGARLINMSFGKSLSPDKAVVDEAVAYAEQKGVLFIHGSGNEKQDNDKEGNFPNRKYANGREAQGWLEVGATSSGTDENFVADFSNYGKKSVDVFAPGVDIYSTVPNNGYENKSGTSMAAPVVTGLAALLWSYYPDFTASQIADIIKASTRKFDRLKVNKPGGGEAFFSDLSNTGGVVNAYEAIRLAESRKSLSIEPQKK